jgi:hypothetical protein
VICPTHPDGTPLTIREQLERAGVKKAKRSAKAATLWPKKVKRPKSKTTAQLEAIYWNVFSFFIRLRDKLANSGLCFYCEKNPIECAMHRIKRGKRATKYDERNVDGGCHTCNQKDRFWPQELDAIFIRKKGYEVFLQLDVLSREECKRSRVDILERTEYYRERTRLLLVG